MIKSFRGQLNDREQKTIRLSTNKGEIGYRIVKYSVFPAGAATGFDYESFVSIWKREQSSVPADGVPNFNDDSLLACALFSSEANTHTNPEDLTVYFDNEVFNQDIFISHSNRGTGPAINYYLELEQFKLDLSEATVATLKDMRADSNIS